MQTDPKEQALRRVANQMEKIGNMLQQWEAKGRNTLLSFVVLISLFCPCPCCLLLWYPHPQHAPPVPQTHTLGKRNKIL